MYYVIECDNHGYHWTPVNGPHAFYTEVEYRTGLVQKHLDKLRSRINGRCYRIAVYKRDERLTHQLQGDAR